jgi:phosphonate transport system substrate-binding protein
LAQHTGKKVVAHPYTNTAADVADFKDGKTHVVALHAADTPYLVNNAGLTPVAVLGSSSGAIGNHLALAVASDSKIKTLDDVRGRSITATTPVSITGHRAAVAVLLQEAGMRPDVDYFINYSLSQTRSILGIANGDYEIAAWSDDKLQSLLKAGRIKPSDYRIIYESQVIPRFTIGYAYNLVPALAEKVRQTILDFKNAEGPADEEGNPPMHFIAIDYKKDFEFARQIDESFEPRIGAKPVKSKGVPAASQ